MLSGGRTSRFSSRVTKPASTRTSPTWQILQRFGWAVSKSMAVNVGMKFPNYALLFADLAIAIHYTSQPFWAQFFVER